jgi:N-acetylneuraminate synthase
VIATTPVLEIGDRLVGDGHPCYVVAEACINHNGDFETALRMVEAARAAGADAIKFQVHYLDDEMLPDVPTSANFSKPLREVLEETNLTDDEHAALKEHCDRLRIEYLCTAYCREAGDFLAGLGVVAFKTGSGEMTNHPFLRSLARHGRPLLVSTGMASQAEVDDMVAMVRETGVAFGVFHCTSEYPPSYDDINLRIIPLYKERYGVVVGHSDHTPNIYSALGAVAHGANLIEKHFTLDKTQPGADHAVSIEPAELFELVRGIRIIEAGAARRSGCSNAKSRSVPGRTTASSRLRRSRPATSSPSRTSG